MIANSGLPGRRRGVYYGWWVLAACSLLSIITGGVFYRGFTVFFLPIQREFNLSRASTALIFSLATAEEGVGGPFVGWLIDRVGSRPLIIAGGILAGTGYMLLSVVHGYIAFLMVYVGIVSLGIAIGLGPAPVAAVNRWFLRRKATALTIVLTCYPLGGAGIVPLLALGVSQLGWRSVVFYTGIFVVSIVVPLALLVRKSPESAGIVVEGLEEAQGDAVHDDEAGFSAAPHDFSVSEAVRTHTYWTLLGANALRIGVSSAILIHLIPIMVWKGTDETAAAGLIALMFFMSIPVRLIAGAFAGLVPTQRLLFVCMISGTLALVGLLVLNGGWVPYLSIVGLAVLEGGSPLTWITLGKFFGRQSFATLMGGMSLFYGAGILLFPVYAGWVFDSTGSYKIALITFASLYGTSAILFAITRTPQAALKTNEELMP